VENDGHKQAWDGGQSKQDSSHESACQISPPHKNSPDKAEAS